MTNQTFKQLILTLPNHGVYTAEVDPQYLGLIVIESIRNMLADFDAVQRFGTPDEETFASHRTDVYNVSMDYLLSIAGDNLDSELEDQEEVAETQYMLAHYIASIANELYQHTPENIVAGTYPLLWLNGEPLFPSFTVRFMADKIIMNITSHPFVDMTVNWNSLKNTFITIRPELLNKETICV